MTSGHSREHKCWQWMAAAWLTAGVFVLSQPLHAQQEIKPIVLVSVAPLQEQMDDAKVLAESLGVSETLPNLPAIATQFGLDMTKPAGVILSVEAMTGQGYAMIPVTNKDSLLLALEPYVGKAAPAGENLLLINTPFGQQVYLTESKGYLFVSLDQTSLNNLPADPPAVFGTLPKEYNLAVQVRGQNVDPNLKQLFIFSMNMGFEQQAAEAKRNNQPNHEQIQSIARKMLKAVQQVVQDTDSLTVGFNVDNTKKSLQVDLGLTAVADSPMAAALGGKQEPTTNYGGFVVPDAALSALVHAQLSESFSEALREFIAAAKTAALEDAAGSANEEQTKGIINNIMDSVDQAIADGKLDLGMLVKVSDAKNISIVLGGYVKGGASIHKAFNGFMSKEQPPDGAKFTADVETHKDVTFSILEGPIKEAESDMRIAFGEQMEFVVAGGKQSLFFGLGSGCRDTIKSLVDGAGTSTAQPSQMTINLQPWAEVATKSAPNSNAAAFSEFFTKQPAAKDQDQIQLTTKPVASGISLRLEVQNGVLQFLTAVGSKVGDL